MNTSNRSLLVLAAALLTHPACKDHTLDQTMAPQSFDGGSDDVCGRQGAGATNEVPHEHRAVATACNPSSQPPVPDGGAPACTTDSDCATDGGFTFYNTCVHGVCAFDQCLTDADCPSGVCACSSNYYGGNALYHPNLCVPSNCHVDSDCGAGGYCSPSRGYCGVFEGFYCHQPADTCVDPTADCASCSGTNACVYTPEVGRFVCGLAICAG
jgi:hypothetical protein